MMNDSRTYTRLVIDKLLKDNFIYKFGSRIVKFYYTLFSHPAKSLKFQQKLPLNKYVKGELCNPFAGVNTEISILD